MSYTLKSEAMKSSTASSSVDRTTGSISYKPFAVIGNINTIQNPVKDICIPCVPLTIAGLKPVVLSCSVYA
jgi:hypothetical protein